MFSGGRDSTLAALLLAQQKNVVTLVTVTSPHLLGLQKVEKRVEEIWKFLPPGSSWRTVEQDSSISSPQLASNTCLPCQRDYVSAGIALALQHDIKQLALGYTNYQSDWPEQTHQAIAILSKITVDLGIELLLPVQKLSSKDEAQSLLNQLGVSHESLEQKCLKQINNVKLDENILIRQLDAWDSGIREKISRNPSLEYKNIKIKT